MFIVPRATFGKDSRTRSDRVVFVRSACAGRLRKSEKPVIDAARIKRRGYATVSEKVSILW